MSDVSRALVIREGVQRSARRDRKHALVVASPSPGRADLVQALRASGFAVVVEGPCEPATEWATDPSLDLVVMDLSPVGRRTLGALGPEDISSSEGPRIVLLAGARGSDPVVERALTAAAGGVGSKVRRSGDPARYASLVDQAKQHVLARDFPSALLRLEEAMDEDDRRPEALNLFGVIADIRGERSEAQRHWRVALLLAPDYEPAQENLRRLGQLPRMRGAPDLG
ncbi:MAG TPA: hypothetical protein VLH75_11605 [Longimicrobiales bacterium]|nr:hypothetical protein [Longimicrobiales bacterium]